MSALAAMRAAKRWLLWKSENSSKVPYYVIGGKRSGTLDSPDDLAKFASYEEARSAMERNPGTYTGLAFALGPDSTGNRWQGIDLDDVEINKLSEFANELPGYVELSPSRNGCHAIGYGRSFITLGSNGTGVEAYEHGRFFTVTEHLIRDSPLSCLSEYVEQRLAPRHRPTAGSSAKSAHIHGVVNLPAQEVSELRSALLHMRADEYGQWIAVGHALVELGDVGRGLWLNWSSTSAVYDESEAAAKWDTFSGDKTAYQAVFKRAQEQGWVNPRSNAARLPKAEVSGEFGNIRVSVADVITDPSPPPEFLIEDLLPAGEVTLLPANGGVGKSLLTLIASVCLATGKPFMGKQTKACRVLFFSAEDATGVIRHRLKRICEHLDVDPVTLSANLWITDATENPCLFIEMQDKEFGRMVETTNTYSQIEKNAEQFGARVIVIDNASDTFDANENVRPHVRAFIRALKRIAKARNGAVWLLAHVDKSTVRGTGGPAQYSGSTAWHNSARSRLLLAPSADDRLILSQEKSNHGPKSHPIELEWTADGMIVQAMSRGPQMTSQEMTRVVLSLIHELYEKGHWISTSFAANATSGAYAVLSAYPQFPKALSRKNLEALLRAAQIAGELSAEPYKTPARHNGVRWRVRS